MSIQNNDYNNAFNNYLDYNTLYNPSCTISVPSPIIVWIDDGVIQKNSIVNIINTSYLSISNYIIDNSGNSIYTLNGANISTCNGLAAVYSGGMNATTNKPFVKVVSFPPTWITTINSNNITLTIPLNGFPIGKLASNPSSVINITLAYRKSGDLPGYTNTNIKLTIPTDATKSDNTCNTFNATNNKMQQIKDQTKNNNNLRQMQQQKINYSLDGDTNYNIQQNLIINILLTVATTSLVVFVFVKLSYNK